MAKLAQEFSEFTAAHNFSIVLNTEGLYFIAYEQKFRDVVSSADLIFCDGIGLKVTLQISGYKNVKRLHGPDLFHRVLHQNDGKKQLIIGGSQKSHEMLIEKYPLLKSNPNIEFYSEMVQENDLIGVFTKIETFSPDIIHVCLGIRKQEFIGNKIRERFKECSIVGVGASIDFESGNVVRSSEFFQNIGLEWLPRLIREPRMIPRIGRSLVGLLRYAFIGFFRFLIKDMSLTKVIQQDNSERS